MIAEEISNIKIFMDHLLTKATFDNCLVNEVIISTFNNFVIDGHINSNYYKDTTNTRPNDYLTEPYSSWKTIKPICYELIKGNRLPLKMSFILAMKRSFIKHLIEGNNIDIQPEDVNDLFMNIKFEKDKLTVITGVSLKVFAMDKSLEKAFDNYIQNLITTLT